LPRISRYHDDSRGFAKRGEGGTHPFFGCISSSTERSSTRRNEAPKLYFRAETHDGSTVAFTGDARLLHNESPTKLGTYA